MRKRVSTFARYLPHPLIRGIKSAARIDTLASSGWRPLREDLWLVSYPRSGNTWLRYMISLAISGQPLTLVDMESIVPDIYRTSLRKLDSLPAPRVFKSHESFTPSYRQVVYIVRDPRSVALSYMNFVWDQQSERKAMDPGYEIAFVERFVRGEIDGVGTWREHVMSWVAARGESEEFLRISYEELVADTCGVLSKVLDHLQIDARMPIDEIVALASRENLLALESAESQRWRRSIGLSQTSFVGGTEGSQRRFKTLEPKSEETILAKFGDTMDLLGVRW